MKKVVIFGAGSASLYPVLGLNLDNCEIVCMIDNDKNKWDAKWLGYTVRPPEILKEITCDYIIISHIYGNQARQQLREIGIPEEKIMDFYGQPEMFYDLRVAVFKTCALELKRRKVPGAVAELGVFQGEFSRHINDMFPEKKLYLFDTFEGFDKKDISDRELAVSAPGKDEFKNTSVKLVMSRMKNPENVEIRKGYFPETLRGLEEQFSFVSLDPDLYLPVRNGLEYFYPRLARGGYLFVHDYNNRRFAGVKQAVDEYCNGKNIPLFPICDIGGSVIISK